MDRGVRVPSSLPKVKDDKTKIQWCRSVIGNLGRCILKGLPEGAQWRQANVELRKYLGEDNPKSAAWKRLRGYKAKGKCFGEIASEVKELAEKAVGEENVRERLAVEAFLGAIPWHFDREIHVKRIDSLKESLEEAKLRKMLEDKEENKKRVQAITEEPYSVAKKKAEGVGGTGRVGEVCWGCGKPGHVLKECELWKEFRRGKQATREAREGEKKPELN